MNTQNRKFRLASIAMAMGLSFGASASMTIVTDAPRSVAQNTSLGESVSQEFVAPRGLGASLVTANFIEMPLMVVLSHIIPADYELLVEPDIEIDEVTWRGAKRWDLALQEIGQKHGYIIHIDTAPNSVAIFAAGAKPDVGELIQRVDTRPFDSGVGSVVSCLSADCNDGVVDFEKLVLDTSWASEQGHFTPDALELVEVDESVDHEAVRIAEREAEEKLLALKSAEIEELRHAYRRAHVLPGKGTFEEFVNHGGPIDPASLDPNEPHTYVYRKGGLWQSIDAWSEANGYTTRNEVYAKSKKNYPNYTDIYLHGTYLDITRQVLDRYKTGDYPVHHNFYTVGSILHIYTGGKYTNNK